MYLVAPSPLREQVSIVHVHREYICIPILSCYNKYFFILRNVQVENLMEKQQNVEEAILLAETIAAVEENKNPVKAEEVRVCTCTNYLHVHVLLHMNDEDSLNVHID